MPKAKYPISGKAGVLEFWHYGDGKLYLYPMNMKFPECSTGTLVLKPREVLKLRQFVMRLPKPRVEGRDA